MSFVYKYTDILEAVDEITYGKLSLATISVRSLINRGVRETLAELDLRTAKRKVQISPGIYNKVYSYLAPADIKGDGICDIARQIDRYEEYNMVGAEEFDVRKTVEKGLVSVDNHDGLKFLLLATELNTLETIISDCDSITGWSNSGDAGAITLDTVNFINGSGSLSYDLTTGGTTATIKNSTIAPTDCTAEKNQSIFAYQYIPLTTGLTSFTLKWGSSASDYWSKTVTTTHEGLAFYTGWNQLRFDWPATATAGTPDASKISYVELVINKTAGMAASNQWRTDFIVARTGDISYLTYYSRYPWTDSSGVFIENSTADTDYLVCEADEFNLITHRCAAIACGPCRMEVLERREIKEEAEKMTESYKIRYPSERLLMQKTYHRFASIDGDNDVGFITSPDRQ